MNRTITWINKTEGRDKFCKAIQYASRILKWHFANTGNKEMAARFTGIFNGMKDARKLFRLFKSINEIQKIIELVKKQDNDELNKALNILCRFFFGLYWYFDNLVILKTVKFIQGDHKADGKNGSTCWLLGLICNHIQNVRGLISNFQEEQNVSQKILASTSEEDTQKLAGQMKKLKKARTDLYLSVLKTSGDTITAGQAANLWPTLLGKSANDGLIGLGGLTSALITSYQLF